MCAVLAATAGCTMVACPRTWGRLRHCLLMVTWTLNCYYYYYYYSIQFLFFLFSFIFSVLSLFAPHLSLPPPPFCSPLSSGLSRIPIPYPSVCQCLNHSPLSSLSLSFFPRRPLLV